MINFPQVPGVIVDETESRSYSINSAASAVPVFVVGPSAEETWFTSAGKPLKLSSFNDFLNYENSQDSSLYTAISLSALWKSPLNKAEGPLNYPRLKDCKKAKVAESEAGAPWKQPFAPSLKAYFDNGGGYCYVCPNDKLEMAAALPDVTMFVQCGQMGATSEILKFCEPGNKLFALLDGPDDEGKFDSASFDAFYNALTPSDCAAIYYPWLKANWSVKDNNGASVDPSDIHLIAPSAVAAGLICKNDRLRGTYKAPANTAVSAGLSPAVKIGDSTQKKYTDSRKMAVNMVRTFPGKGTLIWGARTLSTGGNAWIYINVRRTFDKLERDISAALQSVMFEANGPVTWQAVRAAVTNYLFNLMKEGYFSGTQESECYQVQIGEGITMTAADIEAGILKLRIAVAVARPAEFVILEFTQLVASGG